jgi:hypothetical protein
VVLFKLLLGQDFINAQLGLALKMHAQPTASMSDNGLCHISELFFLRGKKSYLAFTPLKTVAV